MRFEGQQQNQVLISCLDELWNIFQEFGDVSGVNMPGKRSRRKHSKNRSLIPGNQAFFFCLKCRRFLIHEIYISVNRDRLQCRETYSHCVV